MLLEGSEEGFFRKETWNMSIWNYTQSSLHNTNVTATKQCAPKQP